jgi:hypothetical protein
LIGEPSQEDLDIGLATRDGKDVTVEVFTGTSVLSPGTRTDRTESIERILSPLAQEEVGTIRCIGLNVCPPRELQDLEKANSWIVRPACERSKDGHPKNPNTLPVSPQLLLSRYIQLNVCRSKPSTALGDPWPAPTLLPKITQIDGSGDYESELAVVIGKAAKNVSEENAMDYVLGYTAANDVSSRVSQLNQSQWCFSKGFDGACPIGK